MICKCKEKQKLNFASVERVKEFEKIGDEIKNLRDSSFEYIKSQDSHIINLMQWIDRIDYLKNEVFDSGQDDQLVKDLKQMINRLRSEVGFRIAMIFE